MLEPSHAISLSGTSAPDPATESNGRDLPSTEEEINLLDLLVVLAKNKKLIAGCVIGGALVSTLISFLLPSRYTATTKIMPPQQSQSIAGSILGQLGPLAGLAGGNIGGLNRSELYVAMLKSRTAEDALIKQFNLTSVYRTRTLEGARKSLESNAEMVANKEGIISISFVDRDRNRAAQVANGFVVELYKLTQGLAITEASQRRLFFEGQLQNEKDNLANAEVQMRLTQEKSGLIQLDSQARVIIESIARMEAEVAAKEVQLQAMRSFATEANPEYQRASQELQGLKAQVAKLKTANSQDRSDGQITSGQVPEAGLDYVRKLRDVKYHEAIFELLARQFEAAKIDEAKNAAVIQVLDTAVPPERRSFPRRSLFLVIGAALGAILSCSWALIAVVLQHAAKNPLHAAKLMDLHRTLLAK